MPTKNVQLAPACLLYVSVVERGWGEGATAARLVWSVFLQHATSDTLLPVCSSGTWKVLTNVPSAVRGLCLVFLQATGAAVLCVLVGKCKISSTPDTPAASVNYPVLLAAAQSAPCTFSTCPPQFGSSDKYLGYTINVQQWWNTSRRA